GAGALAWRRGARVRTESVLRRLRRTGVGARAAAGGAPAVAAASTEFADSLSAEGTRARVRLGRGPDLEQDRRRAQAGAVAPGCRPGGAPASRTARSGATHDPAAARRRNAGAVRQPAPHLAGDGGHARATARGATYPPTAP